MAFLKKMLVIFFVFSFSHLRADRIVSGEVFRSICDFVLDDKMCTLSPEKVVDGSIIFVQTEYLRVFFERYHCRIKSRYILISHNSDYPCPGVFAQYLDDEKVIAWFGQNPDIIHPKFHAIPIGIANSYWPIGNLQIFAEVIAKKNTCQKEYFLYSNFGTGTFPGERGLVYNIFYNKPFCCVSGRKDFKMYLIDLAKSKFVLSPRGNGLDCHRTWEALLLGAIPIVKTSCLDPLYKDLPVIVVKDWNEVTEEFLNKKYEEMSKKVYTLKELHLSYWLEIIKSYKPSNQK